MFKIETIEIPNTRYFKPVSPTIQSFIFTNASGKSGLHVSRKVLKFCAVAKNKTPTRTKI